MIWIDAASVIAFVENVGFTRIAKRHHPRSAMSVDNFVVITSLAITTLGYAAPPFMAPILQNTDIGTYSVSKRLIHLSPAFRLA